MVGEHDYELPQLNNMRICDNLSQDTIYDTVSDPSITATDREVVYDYPTDVRSGEDERADRRVEKIPSPVYVTVTCSKEHVSSKQLMKNI